MKSMRLLNLWYSCWWIFRYPVDIKYSNECSQF
jgi:hypothetical protein